MTKKKKDKLPAGNKILNYLKGKALSLRQLYKKAGLSGRKEKEALARRLKELEEAGKVAAAKTKYYRADAEKPEIAKPEGIIGVIDHARIRNAFVKIEDYEEDLIIKSEDLHTAMHGDTVRLMVLPGKNRDGRTEAEVIEVIERSDAAIVGRIEISENYAFVNPDNKKIHTHIFLPNGNYEGASNGDKVTVELTGYPRKKGQRPVGKVLQVLGKAGENNTEMHAILAEFGLPLDFPEEVEAEADTIDFSISEKEIARRRDMRKVTTFTIDPLDAKDFDDAISVQKLKNGNWEIGVHIADVSHYVRPGSALDKEAYKRATSVYLVDRVVPMLPERLSNGVCSLRPHEEKFTFSAIFELDEKANIKKRWFGRTVTYSDRRFTYEEAQEVIESGQGDYAEEITLLNDLAHKLRKRRFEEGSISFETAEVKFKLSEDGTPLELVTKVRKEAHMLVEDFMLLANREVAQFAFKYKGGEGGNPFVYRIHEPPKPDRFAVFASFVKKLGYKLSTEPDKISASLSDLMQQMQGKPEFDVIQSIAVRTMSKAVYSTQCIGHFGLAFNYYTHFTSPIRRYPDVMVHRLLQNYLDNRPPKEATALEADCKHSSEREKMASDAEYASIKYKQVEFMQMQDDQTYEGVVSGLTEWGVYVEIISTKCEGMVAMRHMTDDHYDFQPEQYRIVGQRTGKVIRFGDKVEVVVTNTDLQKRIIDLAFADMPKPKSSSSSRNRSSGSGNRGGGSGRGRSNSSAKAKSSSSGRGKSAGRSNHSGRSRSSESGSGSSPSSSSPASSSSRSRKSGRGRSGNGQQNDKS